METEDQRLVAAYLEGDEDALGFLVDRYLPDVYRFVSGLIGNKDAVEDVTQESFVKAWRKIRSFSSGRSFKSWLFAIARNTAIDWLRRQKEVSFSVFEMRAGQNKLVDILSDEEPLPDELLARAEDTAYVNALLLQIDPKYREVLTLRYSSNMTFAEIGAALRRPLHTVKSQHRRALVLLRRFIQAGSV